MRVLFVCLGNICRSPLAEAIFQHRLTAKGLSKRFQADSCGTSNYNLGDGPDQRTIANAARNGVTMTHTARQISGEDLDYYDHILVMDSQIYRSVLSLAAPAQHSKILMMRTFDPLGPGDVPDPYWGDEDDFQEVFEMLERSVTGLIAHLTRQAKANA